MMGMKTSRVNSRRQRPLLLHLAMMSAFIATFMLAKRADDIINRIQGAFALIQIAHQVNCFLTLLAGSDNKPPLNFAIHRELLSVRNYCGSKGGSELILD